MIFYQLVFVLLVIEMVIFVLLVVPFPQALRNVFIRWASNSQFLAQCMFLLKVAFLYVVLTSTFHGRMLGQERRTDVFEEGWSWMEFFSFPFFIFIFKMDQNLLLTLRKRRKEKTSTSKSLIFILNRNLLINHQISSSLASSLFCF
ncbi:hypothetical protein HMI54_010458 [Coelomomyces lativittatus]|nr:hypothetical protein HMI54_010458 [Coelomomyces lativittatus]